MPKSGQETLHDGTICPHCHSMSHSNAIDMPVLPVGSRFGSNYHSRRRRLPPKSAPLHLWPTSLQSRVLKERDFPYSDIKLLTSARSAGKKYTFDGQELTCQELNESRRGGADGACCVCGSSSLA